MDAGAVMLGIAIAISLLSLLFLVWTLVRSIRDERDPSRKLSREFGLGIALATLFFVTWIGQAITQWQVYTDEQETHQQPTEMGDFVAEFGQATLENWQSEFLQLFAFVALTALFIHKGSAESKDGEEKIEASLRRIEKNLGTLPDDAPKKKGEEWKLPETPLKLQDKAPDGTRK